MIKIPIQNKESKIFPVFLISLLLIIFFIVPIFGNLYWAQFIVAILLGTNIMIGVFSIDSSKTIKYITATMAFIIVTIEFFHAQFKNEFWLIFSSSLWVSLFLFLEIVFLLKVFEKNDKNIHRIQGGIACFLLLGLLFAFIHGLIFHINHNAYTISENIKKGGLISYKFIYYSFTTLCTVGYGDITPNTPIAQSFSILEGLAGILFPTIFISQIVTIHRETIHRQNKKQNQN
ncbi:potassium channel family protein [Flavobacterium sp. N3904]|uniref:potassium channel family protein n=1 Tax=Flavobacterium sp. N3904 TaxID=2986835 RepID=UPI002224EE8B|nr:potassium channel family protein [Flavobacterium sp. N3904]